MGRQYVENEHKQWFYMVGAHVNRNTKCIIVGHVPYNLAPRMSAFFMRDINKLYAEITGAKVNWGTGYGVMRASLLTCDLAVELLMNIN